MPGSTRKMIVERPWGGKNQETPAMWETNDGRQKGLG